MGAIASLLLKSWAKIKLKKATTEAFIILISFKSHLVTPSEETDK